MDLPQFGRNSPIDVVFARHHLTDSVRRGEDQYTHARHAPKGDCAAADLQVRSTVSEYNMISTRLSAILPVAPVLCMGDLQTLAPTQSFI
jgi:hypothetical protein